MSELDGLGVELEKLSELEAIREEWQLQAEAQDEVEQATGIRWLCALAFRDQESLSGV